MLRNRIRPPAVVPRTPRRRRALPASFVHRDRAAPHRRRLPRPRCRRRVPPESLAPRRRRRLQSHRPCTETSASASLAAKPSKTLLLVDNTAVVVLGA